MKEFDRHMSPPFDWSDRLVLTDSIQGWWKSDQKKKHQQRIRNGPKHPLRECRMRRLQNLEF